MGPRLGWLLTIAVGVVAGAAAVALVWLIHLVERVMHTGGVGLDGALRVAALVLAPAVGGLLVGLLLRYVVPEAEGSGIPQTSVLIIFELTNTYTIILPLMLANTVAYTIAERLAPVPIYEALLAQSGITLPSPTDDRLARVTVARAMSPALESLPADFTVVEAKPLLPLLVHRTGTRGEGRLSLADLAARRPVATAYPDETLDAVVVRLSAEGIRRLPVVPREDPTRVVGIVTMRDVLAAYARASR